MIADRYATYPAAAAKGAIPATVVILLLFPVLVALMPLLRLIGFVQDHPPHLPRRRVRTTQVVSDNPWEV